MQKEFIPQPWTASEITERLTQAYGPCSYDDASHVYKDHKDNRLPSITQLKSNVCSKFDPNLAHYSARKEGVTVEHIRERWGSIGDCGTMVHEAIEAILFDGQCSKPKDSSAYSPMAHERYAKYIAHNLPQKMANVLKEKGLVAVAAELKVWCPTAAGTLDILAWNPKTNRYHVVDWKTNAKGGFDTLWPSTKTMAAPFDAYMSTKLGEYSLQLESYAVILETIGFVFGPGLVVHGYLDGIFESPKIDLYDTLDLKKLTREWLGL